MRTALLAGTGLAACGAAAFFLSLLHVSLNSCSKISFSGILEDRDKEYRQRMLDRFDDLGTAVETLRILALLAASLCLFLVFPRGRFWPAGPALTILAGYLLLLEFGARLVNTLSRGRLLSFFLPVLGPLLVLSSPLTFVSRRLQEREDEDKEETDEPREATEDAIETFLDEAQEEGIIEKEEESLLRGVVEFGGTLVREIMTPRVKMVCIRKDATIERLR